MLNPLKYSILHLYVLGNMVGVGKGRRDELSNYQEQSDAPYTVVYCSNKVGIYGGGEKFSPWLKFSTLRSSDESLV